MGQGLSRGAREAGKHVARDVRKTVRAPPKRPTPAPSATPSSPDTAGDVDLSDSQGSASPVVGKDGFGPMMFGINKDAVEVSAGPWTSADPPVDDELLAMVQEKDEDLVRMMQELPDIKMSVPKESVGSRKISRTLPQDRTSHPRPKGGAPPMFDGTLNSAQIHEMLLKYADTPHDTPVLRCVRPSPLPLPFRKILYLLLSDHVYCLRRNLLVSGLAEEYKIDSSLADAVVAYYSIPKVYSRYEQSN